MKKRILSIILAFAMIMTMIPQTAFAETPKSSDGYLAYRYSHYDDNYFVDYDEPLNTSCSMRRDMTSEVYFFFVEGDTETQVLASQIYSSDESIAEVVDVDEYLVMLVPRDYGTTTVNYEKDGKVYSVSLEVQLEEYGYCTSPELTKDSIVEKFSVAKAGDKLYFATKEGYQLDEVELLDDFQNIADAKISADKTYIEITFKAIPENGAIYELGTSYMSDPLNSHHAISPITLYDGTPGLRYRQASWSHETESFYGDPEEELLLEWTTEPAVGDNVIFYYIENGVETEIPLEELIVADESVVGLSKSDDGKAVLIEAIDFGSTTIGYIKDGVEYTVDVNVELPTVAFYTEPTANENAFILDFTVTKEKNTFYFVAREDWEITTFEVEGSCKDYATVSLSEDKSYLTIQMDKDAPNGWLNILCELENEDDWTSVSSTIMIESGKSSLVYKDIWLDEGNYVEEEDVFCLDLIMEYSYSTLVHFYLKEGESATSLSPFDIKSADESIVTVAGVDDNDYIAEVTAVGAGETEILYTVGDVTYSMPVKVELPIIGCYSAPEATPDTVINEFDLTEHVNEFYIVACDGWKIIDCELKYDFKDFATATMSEDETYVKVTVSEEIESSYYYVTVEGYHEEYEAYTTEWLELKINNYLPGLRYSNLYDTEDGFIEGEAFSSAWKTEPGWEMLVGFYYFENGVKTKVDCSDLVVSDENVVKIEPYGADNHAVYVKSINCGEATINYTVNGKTCSVKVIVDLPDFGFYSSPNASQDTLINQFVAYNGQDTFYFVARNGWELTYVGLEDELAEIAEVKIDPVSRTYATIKLKEEVKDFHAYVSYDAINNELGEEIYDWGCGLYIENGNPALKFKYGVEEDGEVIEIKDSSYASTYWGENGSTAYVYLYHVENGEETRVKYNQVTSSNDEIVQVQRCDQDDNATILQFVGFGEATIEYTVNGKTYSIDVSSELPISGFFSTTDYEEETFITEFEVTETNKTFYLMTSGDSRFDTVTLLGNAAEYAEAKVLTNKQIVEITITGDVEGEEYLEIDAVIDVPMYDYSYDQSFGITVYDEKPVTNPPALKAWQGVLVDGNVVPNEEDGLNDALSSIIGRENYYFFYYEKDGKLTNVKFDQLKVADDSIVKLSRCEENENAVIFKALRYGETTIDYTVNGKKYSVAIDTFAGITNFFTTPEMNSEDCIGEFTVTNDKDTFYLITSQFIQFKDVWLSEEFEAIADASIDPNNDHIIKIKVTGIPEDGKDYTIYAKDYVTTTDSYGEVKYSITLYSDIQEVILKGWQYIDGNWYFYDNEGNKVTNQWRKDSKGWCFLGEDGAMLTNQWVKDSVGYCFVDESGYMVYNQWCEDANGLAYAGSDGYRQTSKWIQDSKGWSYVDETGYKVYNEWVSDCYIDDTGYMAANKWIETDDGFLYMGANGYKTTNKWVQRAGKWCYLGANGYAVTNQWMKDSTGWCYLDDRGFMVYDQWIADSKGLCYVGSNGYMATNQWVETAEGKVYVGGSGYKVTNGWVKDSNGMCYLGEDGLQVYDQWVTDDNGTCYIGSNGYVSKDMWIQTDDGWCYVGSDGYRVANQWLKKVGNWAYVGADGYLVTNDWAKDGSRWCYMDDKGFMTKDQWINDGTGSCYMDANGYLVTNKWLMVDGEWVYVGNSGYMVVNAWAKDSKGWCYLDENGHMVYNDWVADSKGEVYLDASGYMVTNKWIAIGDEWCYVGSDGYKVTNQWRKDSAGWCYLGEDGLMLRNQWVKDSVGYCYVDGSGYMVYSQWVEIDENRYYVNSAGYRVENKWVKLDGKEYYFKEDGVMARDEKIGNYYVDENGVYIPGV